MKAIALSVEEKSGFQKILKSVGDFCEKHPCLVGSAEIVAGAGLIGLAIKFGAVEMGTHLVGLDGGSFNVESLVGAGGGGVAGSAASILGNLGIATGGGAIGIPAALLGVAAAGVGVVAGYSAGDVVHNLLNHVPTFLNYIKVGSLLVVGTALIIDGCRRILGSEAFKKAWSSFQNGILHLADAASRVVCKSKKELSNYLSSSQAGGASAVAGATAGAAIGTSVAASTVTVLGSHALGGLALSLGLVSAPLWPVIACGVGGAALGVGIWKLCNLNTGKSVPQLEYKRILRLPAPRVAQGQ